MNSFQVLDRNQDIHHSCLLEASAGTGKTFSIENIVVRLLLEGDNPLTIESVLVVTFTKAATRDLRVRIRNALEMCLKWIDSGSPEAHDYLRAITEQGPEAIEKAKKRLDQALFCFDQAQIFTIHGFCFRMLRQNTFEGDFSFDALMSEESVSDDDLLQMIRDYFRSRLTADVVNAHQLEIVLNKLQDKFERTFLKTIKDGYDIIPGPTYTEYFNQFEQAVEILKQNQYNKEKLIADFEKQHPCYKKTDGDDLFDIQQFAQMLAQGECTQQHFNQLLKDRFYYLQKFCPSNVNKRKKTIPLSELNYPYFYEELYKLFGPLQDACRYEWIYSRLAYECQTMVKQHLRDNEKMVFGDFLESMAEALKQPDFCAHVQSKYRAAIIDEFQDTDPVQWEIFKKLFLLDNKLLYLVGDPKQSIYAFRRADIYTYRDAALSIPSDYHGCLDTNYRSQPSLISALNQLFSSAKDFIELPRVQAVLDFHPVRSSPKAEDVDFQDDRGSLHFMISEKKDGEEADVFPFMINEIQELMHKGTKLKNIAVLVKDRYQAKKFADLCVKWTIPVALQKRSQLSESPLIPTLQELIKATLYPKNLSHIKIALGSVLIGWNHHQVFQLTDMLLLEKIIGQFYQLRRKLLDEGFSSFYLAFLDSHWHEHDMSAREVLLQQQGGADLLDEMDQIAAMLIDHQGRTHCIPEGLIKFLTDFRATENQDEDSIKKDVDAQLDAVQILSMHSSKGLEYDVVFSLGLSASSPQPGLLVPVPQGTKQLLKAVDENSDEYQAHCREMDAEKMRQLYVAMTRAKYRLYVPVILVENTKPSIIDLFLNKLPIDKTLSSLTQFIDTHKPMMNYSVLNNPLDLLPMAVENQMPSLVRPNRIDIPGHNRYMQSYTSMSKRFVSPVKTQDVAALKPPREFICQIKSSHTLPAGAETGIILHKIFENIPLNCCRHINGPSELTYLIRPFVRGSKYEEWLDTFCDVVFKALTTSFGDFRLTDIDPEKCFREIEFLYPSEAGFTKGVIDLVFEHDGLYYIVDWKSNWLGPDNSDYTIEKMHAAMTEHDYFLQGELYIEAWKRYLKISENVPFEDCFGGVYYFFARGISDTTGIFKLNNFLFCQLE